MPNHEAVVVRGGAGSAPRHDAVTEQPRTVIRAVNSHAAAVHQQQQLPQPATPPFSTTEEQRAAQWVQPGWALPPQPVEHTPSMAAASTLGEPAATSVRASAGRASGQPAGGGPRLTVPAGPAANARASRGRAFRCVVHGALKHTRYGGCRPDVIHGAAGRRGGG